MAVDQQGLGDATEAEAADDRKGLGRAAVRWLAAVGVLLLVLGSTGWWLTTRVLSADGFADVAAKASQKEEVRDYIADQASLRLARTSNFVSAARPVVADAISAAIATPPVEAAIHDFVAPRPRTGLPGDGCPPGGRRLRAGRGHGAQRAPGDQSVAGEEASGQRARRDDDHLAVRHRRHPLPRRQVDTGALHPGVPRRHRDPRAGRMAGPRPRPRAAGHRDVVGRRRRAPARHRRSPARPSPSSPRPTIRGAAMPSPRSSKSSSVGSSARARHGAGRHPAGVGTRSRRRRPAAIASPGPGPGCAAKRADRRVAVRGRVRHWYSVAAITLTHPRGMFRSRCSSRLAIVAYLRGYRRLPAGQRPDGHRPHDQAAAQAPGRRRVRGDGRRGAGHRDGRRRRSSPATPARPVPTRPTRAATATSSCAPSPSTRSSGPPATTRCRRRRTTSSAPSTPSRSPSSSTRAPASSCSTRTTATTTTASCAPTSPEESTVSGSSRNEDPTRSHELDRLGALTGVADTSGKKQDVYFCHDFCELGAVKATDILSQVERLPEPQPHRRRHSRLRGLREAEGPEAGARSTPVSTTACGPRRREPTRGPRSTAWWCPRTRRPPRRSAA